MSTSAFAILSFSFFLVVAVSVDVPPFYESTDNFFLDCSSSDLSSLERISSLNDSKPNFYVVSKAYTREPTFSGKSRPAACLHKKQITYAFPVSSGPKFVRLHFKPISYSGFPISRALFSVIANHYTLLKTSNASYSGCKSGGCDSYTVKEFCINVDDQVLNVTFIPSPDVSGAYAFFNKIEVVPMTSNLYIREGVPLPLIGQPSPYKINNSRALEIMHRLNIGGVLIPGEEDTAGMFRQWENDANFLSTYESNTGVVNSNVQINHSLMVPVGVAPQFVYASARTVAAGRNQDEVKWSLPVDSGFHYLVRLHFCEISRQIRSVDQRVFHVYIKDQTAEDRADIFRWGDGAGIPVYRDYIINFSEDNKGVEYLSLSIENINGSIKTNKPAMLNGLEVFKLSDCNNKSLAGPFSFGARNSMRNDDHDDAAHIATVILSVRIFSCALIISLILGLSYKVFVSDVRQPKNFFTQSESSDHCKSFSFDELKLATDNFSDALLLGAGGYGKVYKGSVNSDTNFVAIKRSKPCSNQGLNELQTEILLLSQLRHCHLVSH